MNLNLNEERILQKGRLAEANQQLNELNILADSDMMRMRIVLDPFQDDACKINVDEAMQTMTRLYDTVHKMRDLTKKVIALEEALGIKK